MLSKLIRTILFHFKNAFIGQKKKTKTLHYIVLLKCLYFNVDDLKINKHFKRQVYKNSKQILYNLLKIIRMGQQIENLPNQLINRSESEHIP